MGLRHNLLVGGLVARVNLLLFKAQKNLPRAAHHRIREARHLGHMDTVTRVAGTRQNLVEEYELVALLLHSHLEVPSVFQAVDQAGQFVVVRRKKRKRHAGGLAVQRLHDGPCNREPVKRAGTAADFIEQHQAVRGRIAQDVRRLDHLDHKGTETAAQAVARAHAGEYAVHHANASALGRHKASDLRHEHNEPGLAQVRRFTCHIRPRNEHEACAVGAQRNVVRDKVQIRVHGDNHRVEPSANFNPRAIEHLRANIVVLACGAGKTVQAVDAGNGVGNLLEFGAPAVHAFAQFAKNLVFQRMNVYFGVADDGLAFLHLGRDVAFAVHSRLLADVFLGNRLRRLRHLRLGNLDVVTEHAVVAHLEARDPQAFAFADFEGGNPFPAFLDVCIHRIELGIGAGSNHAALAYGERQVFVEILEQFLAAALCTQKRLAQALEHRSTQPLQHVGHLGGLAKRASHSCQVARIGTPRSDASHQAFHVEDARERILELVQGDRILHQFRHRLLTAANLLHRN